MIAAAQGRVDRASRASASPAGRARDETDSGFLDWLKREKDPDEPDLPLCNAKIKP
jgi:hypothetical protein